MKKQIDIKAVIAEVIARESSFFQNDLDVQKAALAAAIAGKSALVIGGAGTIGSAFIKALLRYGKLARLYVVDTNENGLTELVRDVRSSIDVHVPKEFITYPVNFGDAVFEKILEREGPFEIIANFAAHKHVRSEKDIYSVEAMFDNNVFKAKRLLDLIAQRPPEHFFCVSTDKAANPVNLMGASKKLMEDVIMAYAHQIPVRTARFANVAFSNGSLPFGFMERLMKKQPFSAPADVRRFFVSPDESGEICMMACLLGQSGDIFFPKLDAQQHMNTFTFIAERLLAHCGFQPIYCPSEQAARDAAAVLKEDDTDYPVYFFESDTSGEKPYEEFYTEKEELDTTRFHSLGIIKNRTVKPMSDMEEIIAALQFYFLQPGAHKEGIVEIMKDYLGNFEHIETGKSLDQKM